MQKINYPLIVSDFDGTLVKEDGTISEYTKKTIRRYINDGGKFAVSTGRMPAGILPRIHELGLSGLVCCGQGTAIVEIDTNEVLLHGRMPNDVAVTVCEKMESLGLHIHVYDLWEFYSNMDDEALKFYENAVRSKATLVLDKKMSQFVREKKLAAYKLLAMVDVKDNARVYAALEAEHFEGCCITKSDNFLVEVINANYSKGTAVRALAEYYGVSLEKTVTIGDQQNDIPMIEAAGLGVAVKNADDKLKEAADYVSEYTNEEGAVADVIERFGFGED